MTPEQILDQLDDQQRLAAQLLTGPTCIIAGAGTGKTRTITHRIAYGVATGQFSPNRVLALTYTNKAAAELRTRLRALGVSGVSAKTFHSAALSQLEYFWPQFTGAAAPKVIESKSKLIIEAAASLKLKLDAASVRDVAAAIEWLKYSLTAIGDYSKIRKNSVAGMSPTKLLELITKYEELKIARQQIDWEDVLLLTIGLLKSEPRALAHVHAQYRFFTVDEYQDISPLQQELLDVWLGNRNEICVVGDPNQTIYTFTGASSRFLQTFSNRFEGAQVVTLTKNYRSSESIIATANRLATSDSFELESASKVGSAKPRIQEFESVSDEAAYVVSRIEGLLAQGASPADIAILYRVNGQSEAFENALISAGISYQVRGGEKYFQRPEIQAAIRAIRAEALSGSSLTVFESVSNIIRSLGWQALAPETKGAAREKWEALNGLLTIVDELPETADLGALALELDERMRSSDEPQRAAITLSTIHAAKGLEWPCVFVVGVSEGYLPISYAKTEAEIFEEQRLFYVAVTRAMQQLVITWSKRDNQKGWQREPSRFLGLITS